jgi:hypothetical protein
MDLEIDAMGQRMNPDLSSMDGYGMKMDLNNL